MSITHEIIPSPQALEFWNFSLSVYQKETTQEACLTLQNRCDANVNLLLFCCWLGYSGYESLEMLELRKYLASLYKWHKLITQPLRKLRRCLNRNTDLQALKQNILETELAAEQCEQHLLAEQIALTVPVELSTHQKLRNAIVNLRNYTRLLKHKFTQQDHALLAQLLSDVFHEFKPQEINELCKTGLRF